MPVNSTFIASDNTVDSSQDNPAHEEKLDAVEALKCIDDRWYKTIAGKKARWMDLIGDYAGNERFILDGESLLQHVLGDPLLALARTDDPSFQVMHAVHSMERLLNEMLRRSAIFDIVFWEDTRHLTLKGGTDYLVSSRSLARALLFSHLVEHSSEMGLEIFAFSSSMDPAWLAYQQRTKPMFVMLNDGGIRKDINYDMAMRILIQRRLIVGLLTSGVAVTLLREAEFRYSKIFSFVLEERFGLETRESFPTALWNAARDGQTELENLLKGQTSHVPLAPLHVTPPPGLPVNELDNLLKEVLDYLVTRQIELPHLFWELTSLFFLHIVFLQTLPVSERARPHEGLNEDIVAMLVGTFLPIINPVMASSILKSNRFVDIDGRVFTRILRYTIYHGHLKLTELVGPEICSRLETVWGSVNAPPPDFMKLSSCFPNSGEPEPSSTASDGPKPSEPFALLPFHNHLFDEELAAVLVKVSGEDQTSSPRLEFCQGTPFTDTSHWHNNHRAILPKHLGGKEWKDADDRSRQRRLRKGQRFMAQMQRLSASLTGASGSTLKQILITSTGRKVSEIIDDSSICKPQRDEKAPVKKSKPVTPARERIRQEHAQKKKAKEDSSSQEWWLEQLRQVKMIATYENKMSSLRSLVRNPRAGSGWLFVEVRLYRLHLTIQQWIDEHDRENAAIHDHYTVSIIRVVKELYTGNFLKGTTLAILASVMISLGFGNYISPLEEDASRELQTDRVLTFDFVKLLKSKSHKPIHKFMAIKEDPVVWQLRVFGEYMDRSMDSAPDPWVSFQPDAWQHEVLDGLDEPKSSLLVVAPTSAGKTFISYYAMEKVLRESDDGVLVYVAPTKALVNQVAAEVHARFRKEVDGQIFWSIQTRDYRVHDFQKCQILVTVPEMLAIMLLSPPLARTWNPRIRRIILDEIHTIGQDEGGTVWEQIILLAPCPIIGLSATIGMPEKFNAWLETFACFPQLLDKNKPFLGLDNGRPSNEMMRFIHPVSTLSFAGTMPPDLSLESSDLLRLYKVLLNQNLAGVEQLDPNIVFSRDTFIRQKDVLRYEAEIKDVLACLIAAPDALDSSSKLQMVVLELQDPVLKGTPKSQLNAPPSFPVLLSGLIHLLTDMQASDGLPALLFNFDRHECVTMVSHILEALENAEEVWRAKSLEWKRKMGRWEAWKTRQKNKERLTQKAAARKRDPDDPSPQFSFACVAAYPKEDLLEDIRSLSWTSTPDFLFRALRRGIAVHHSGMNKAYRVLVERLFRIGFLRVVIATGTLALGINAPTKSSVFCGDSPLLTALTFRQCAGRAGRRGFDLLGRVVFYGIPLDRINRLLLSRLPRLTGTFPLSSTMVLRLFSLLEGSNYAPYAVHAIRSILQLPHISFGCEVGKGQLLQHLRFSIDHLRRTHLLSQEGKPINLFGLASHIYHTEPSNIAMAVLLQHGVIHDICSQASSVEAERDLVVLLCHLFGRRYLPEVYATTSNIRDLVQKGPSCVVLAPLHPNARAVLLAHQKQTLGIFSAYALAFSSQHADELGLDNRLPLNGVVGPSDTSALPRTPLFAYLSETTRKPKARSLFVATSGHDDTFGDVGELARTVRHGVHLNEHAIPTVEHILDLKLPLNAYLYDFFVHGQVDALVNMNGLRRGDVWFAIEAFHLILITIRGDLENVLTSMSKDSDREETDSEGADDNGYYSSGEEGGEEAGQEAFERQRRVQDKDWKVYEVVNSITNQFGAKFRAIWA